MSDLTLYDRRSMSDSSAASRKRKWRENNPHRQSVQSRRDAARVAAGRQMRRLNPALYERVYREECEKRGVPPYGSSIVEGKEENP